MNGKCGAFPITCRKFGLLGKKRNHHAYEMEGHGMKTESVLVSRLALQSSHIWRLRWLSVVLALLILGLPAQAKDFQKELVPPVTEPISLNKSGEILNVNIRVIEPDAYYFRLRFYFREKDRADRARVRELTGGQEVDMSGKALNSGMPTPLLLQISCMDGTVVDQKEVDPLLTSWGTNNFDKVIGFTRLLPGTYGVRLVLQRAAPAFDGTPVAFVMASPPKTSFKPQQSDRRTACPR